MTNQQSLQNQATAEIDTFLKDLVANRTPPGRGRLLFALDATASRQPTWDTACNLQAEMFREVATIGKLDMQLVYYRGLGECRASRWISDPKQLAKTMSQIMCHAGETQIEKVLIHAKKETKLLQVSALVFVGDAMEENPDTLAHEAGNLGRLGVPAFMFHENHNRLVEQTFQDIARLTHGAYCRFDKGSARQLGDLLKAVAAFATGGMPALAAQHNPSAVKLLGQLRESPGARQDRGAEPAENIARTYSGLFWLGKIFGEGVSDIRPIKNNRPEYFLNIRLPCHLGVNDGIFSNDLPLTPVALARGDSVKPAILFQNSSQLDCVFPVGTNGARGVLIELF